MPLEREMEVGSSGMLTVFKIRAIIREQEHGIAQAQLMRRGCLAVQTQVTIQTEMGYSEINFPKEMELQHSELEIIKARQMEAYSETTSRKSHFKPIPSAFLATMRLETSNRHKTVLDKMVPSGTATLVRLGSLKTRSATHPPSDLAIILALA